MSFGDTTITVIGNITSDPDLRFTQSGAPVASFTIASSSRVFDKDSGTWKDGETLFMRCSAWRELAENTAETLARGQRVIAYGRLKQRDYQDKDGVKRTIIELDVEDVGPSLRYATAKVTKTTRPGGVPHPAAGAGMARSTGGQTGAPDPWQSSAPVPAAAAGGAAYPGEPPF